jgi:hypothetical protein
MSLSSVVKDFEATLQNVVPYLQLNLVKVREAFPGYSPNDTKPAFGVVAKLLTTVASPKKRNAHRHSLANMAEIELEQHLATVNAIGKEVLEGKYERVAEMFQRLVAAHKSCLYIIQTGERFEDDVIVSLTAELKDALGVLDQFNELSAASKELLAGCNVTCDQVHKRVDELVAAKGQLLESEVSKAQSKAHELETQTQEGAGLVELIKKHHADAGAVAVEHASTMAAQLERAKNAAVNAAEVENQAKASLLSVKEAAESISKREAQINEQQGKVAKVEEQLEGLREQVFKLLPSAAAAGLAHSFRERKRTYSRPRLSWTVIFLGALGLIAGVNVWGIAAATEDVDLLTSLLARLPITIPLAVVVWFSGIRIKEMARLEEEYAFKEARASSYEGYRREAANLDGNASTELSKKLLEGTLIDIARHPISMMHVKQGELSPLPHVLTGAAGLANAVNRPQEPGSSEGADNDLAVPARAKDGVSTNMAVAPR